MRKFFSYLGLSLLIFFFTSCGTDFVVNESKSVKNPWLSSETVEFSFEILDTISAYSFSINVRNSTDYDFSNIYFFINTVFPNGTETRDTVECILANVRGKWLGKGMGNLKESSHSIREKINFPASGIYTIKFEQAMREEELYGIKDIGIKIIKAID